ncbi:hypothetical protein CONLIGDRAFT_608787 [Coniochaeta ligniaria NRRL 30616]|uniref:mRNA splicing factor RNA helicase n=1 Tax=Coniochaeta ligniaria NRRL 30616 TaxID=1408157 RepID=A0A1J7J6S0_9PEZI|nr:hypothetical protein CONLIGDRAFT_608787 [Coniochaeta ligniaria NRRL 30616]
MESVTTQAAEPQLPSFRPGKKRRIYRHRAEDTDDAPLDASLPLTNPESRPSEDAATDGPDTEAHLPLSAIRRQPRKSRLGGVAFRAGPPRADEQHPPNTEQSLVPHDAADTNNNAVVGGIRNRFAPQTGLVGELVNKHMEEYIESELAKRHAAEARAAAAGANGGGAGGLEPIASTTADDAPGKPAGQPAMQGKLMEIDLGDEARARNVAMTERARRRALGEAVEEEEDSGASSSQRPRKVRLGRDGKPWRGRNRRNSEDVKRDQLVEEFLKENRLDVYDMPPEPPAVAGPSTGDEGADEKIAEEFRREFMDAMMQRQQRRRPATNAKPVPKGSKAAVEEVLKGPKLGGSRNQRAAMRDILLKEQERKK